jgi:hypothetical protein
MTNAEAIFSAMKSYADVQNFLGTQENIFLDFKEREPGWNSLGKMADNEKRLYSKAASGFAHQQGGVLVWGVEARKNQDGIDRPRHSSPFWLSSSLSRRWSNMSLLRRILSSTE